MTKNCWNSQALAEISCYLAFAGAMLYLVRSGRYLSYVTPKLAPYLCFSAAVMGGVGPFFPRTRVSYSIPKNTSPTALCWRSRFCCCWLPHDTVGLRDISDSAGLLNGSMVRRRRRRGAAAYRPPESPIPSNQEDTEAEGARPGRGIRRRLYDPGCLWRPPLSSTDITPGSKPSQSAMRSSTTGCAYFIRT